MHKRLENKNGDDCMASTGVNFHFHFSQKLTHICVNFNHLNIILTLLILFNAIFIVFV